MTIPFKRQPSRQPRVTTNSPECRRYKAGDPESYDYLVAKVSEVKIAPNDDLRRIWNTVPKIENLFWVMDEEFLPFNVPRGVQWTIDNKSPEYRKLKGGELWAASVLARASLSKATARHFSFSEKGFIHTTTFVACVLDGMNMYFENARGVGKQRAFRLFQQVVESGYKMRLSLVRFNGELRKNPSQNWAKLASKLEKYRNKQVFVSVPRESMGHFVLRLSYSCGSSSVRQDRINCRKLRAALKRSRSMREFLEFLITGNGKTAPLKKSA